MSSFNASEFLSALEFRRDLCSDLLDLSGQQAALIETNNYTQLLLVLGQKQRILGQLDELKQRFPGIQQRWPTLRETIDPSLRNDCERLLAETETLLADLLNEEQESTEFLTKRRNDTQRRLQAVAEGPRIHSAYRDSLAPATNRILDVDQ
jgi:hypothetical protein